MSESKVQNLIVGFTIGLALLIVAISLFVLQDFLSNSPSPPQGTESVERYKALAEVARERAAASMTIVDALNSLLATFAAAILAFYFGKRLLDRR